MAILSSMRQFCECLLETIEVLHKLLSYATSSIMADLKRRSFTQFEQFERFHPSWREIYVTQQFVKNLYSEIFLLHVLDLIFPVLAD